MITWWWPSRVTSYDSAMAFPKAEVIKVENPQSPDYVRTWGVWDDPSKTAQPALLKKGARGGGSDFVQANRGKKAIALDPGKPNFKELMHRLLETADVFLTNVRKQGLKRLGLDYETISKDFPRLICAHVTAFGQVGPMENNPGYDFSAFWAYI